MKCKAIKLDDKKCKTNTMHNSDYCFRHDKKGKCIKKPKDKGGRAKIELTDKQKELAIRYVKNSGLWKVRLAMYLGIDVKTLRSILKSDKSFSLVLQTADAEFCGKIIKKAKPDFILKTKYREEFSEKVGVEHRLDKELREFFDRNKQLMKK